MNSHTPDIAADPKGPQAADVFCGGRVRAGRRLRNQSQEALADACGVSFQQIQKYENGANRISISRLVEIAQSQDLPLAWYFEGLQGQPGVSERIHTLAEAWLASADAVQWAEVLGRMSPKVRDTALLMAKALAQVEADR